MAISGGCGDIGGAIGRRMEASGAAVALGDLGDLQDRRGDHHGEAFFHELDVACPESVRCWYDAVEAEFGRAPSVVVVNAAIVTLKPLLSLSPAEWSREMEVNLSGAHYFASEGARRLRAGGRGRQGRIIFIGSWAAHAPHRALPAYSIAKAGLRMLAQCLALELAGEGIAVNEIAPGYVNAGLSGRVFEGDPAVKASATAAVPLQQLIEPEEVAAQVLYLCSDYAAQMTGSTLLMDGGLSLLQGPLTEP